MLYYSNRNFKIWAYTASHNSLLLRSIMKFSDEDGFSEDTSYNIDIELWSVTFISIPAFFRSLKIVEISEDKLPDNIDRELCKYNHKIFEFQDGLKKHYIIAGGLLVGVNRWENEDRIFNYGLNLQHDEIIAKT